MATGDNDMAISEPYGWLGTLNLANASGELNATVHVTDVTMNTTSQGPTQYSVTGYGTGTTSFPMNNGNGFQITSPTISNEPCTYRGHIFNRAEDNIEYADGVLVSYCEVCGVRLEIKGGIPGGLSMQRVKWLVGEAMALKAGEAVDFSRMLGELRELEDALETDTRSLAVAEDLLQLARIAVEEHV